MQREIRWGIVGCGRISQDFVRAIRLCKTPNKIVAVACADSLKRAREFLEEHSRFLEGARCYGSYGELFADKEIDIVYIANLTHQHKKAVLAALTAGKPVLCEKTLGVNEKEVREMVEKARKERVFLMEGYWSRCFPMWREIMTRHLPSLGPVQLFQSDFGCPVNRVNSSPGIVEGGEGYLLASGCYGLMLAQLVFGAERPVEIKVRGSLQPNGLDIWADILVRYEGDRLARVFYSGKHRSDGTLSVQCEKGTLRLPEFFWSPEKAIIRRYPAPKPGLHLLANAPSPDEQISHPLPDFDPSDYYYPHTAGLLYQIDHCAECVREGRMESDLMGLEESCLLAEMLDEVRKQLGIFYPQDKEEE